MVQRTKKIMVGWLIAALIVSTGGTARADMAGEFEKLRTMDRRLAAVAFRLVTANDVLCPDHAPATGLVIHTLDQYAPSLRLQARKVFGFATPVAIAAVAPDSPAARAGVKQNDGLTQIGDSVLSATDPGDKPADSRSRDAVLGWISNMPASSPLRLTLVRGGMVRPISIAAVSGCRARFEVVIDDDPFAQADGEIIQLSSAHFNRYDDDGIAVTAAHELAHTILRHRARLAAAGVSQGFAAKFGRDRRLTRQAEDEADRLSVYLLYNAGYDPEIAVRYWQNRSEKAGILGHRTHAPPKERARILGLEIARLRPGATRPVVPALVSDRNRAIDERTN